MMPTSLLRSALRAPAPCRLAHLAATSIHALRRATDTTNNNTLGQQQQHKALVQHLSARYAREPQTPVTVRDLLAIALRSDHDAARLQSARWLHAELPVRLAHRMVELEQLPHGLANMPSVVKVHDMYTQSFLDMVHASQPHTTRDAITFTESTLARIRERHEDVVKLLAKGLLELKDHCGKTCSKEFEIRSFLDRFYMSRISIRVLLSHHLALGQSPPGHAGIIHQNCNPADVAQRAADAARALTYAHYGEAPDVHILGNTDIRFPYIEQHVFRCVFELLKNSLRATTEKHSDGNKPFLPPVRVVIAGGREDVTIKISDEGGGFRRSELDRIWTYMFTTAKIPAPQLLEDEDTGRTLHTNRPDPIAGFGYGLPLSRLYARYFGGELSLTSMEGHGTDAYLYLSALGNRAECLL